MKAERFFQLEMGFKEPLSYARKYSRSGRGWPNKNYVLKWQFLDVFPTQELANAALARWVEKMPASEFRVQRKVGSYTEQIS